MVLRRFNRNISSINIPYSFIKPRANTLINVLKNTNRSEIVTPKNLNCLYNNNCPYMSSPVHTNEFKSLLYYVMCDANNYKKYGNNFVDWYNFDRYGLTKQFITNNYTREMIFNSITKEQPIVDELVKLNDLNINEINKNPNLDILVDRVVIISKMFRNSIK